MMSVMPTPDFWDSGLRFACTQCSKCCRHDSGFVFLSEDDLDRLCRFTQLAPVEFVERYCRWVPFGADAHLSLTEQANRDCVFWKDGGCSVYEARPLQCRTYPFWSTIVDEERHWQQEALECPGIGIGRARDAAEIASAVASRRMKPPMLRSTFNERRGDAR
jgi:Fe-S-cluster containining protein